MNPMVIVAVAYAILLPVGLLIWWKVRTKEKLWCFVAGAVCFALFAYGLENLLHQFCVFGSNPVAIAITGSPILFMLYGSFAAGIFEETGRLFGFKVLLRHHREVPCAVAYGIGHGGIEVILLLGMTYAVYLLVSLGVPVGDADTTAQIAAIAGSLPAGNVLLAMVERISAMMLHIGLSMIMFTAVRQKGMLWRFPVCILIHALADAPACLFQYQIITSLALIEITAFVMGVIVLLVGRKLLARYAASGAASEAESAVAAADETLIEE